MKQIRRTFATVLFVLVLSLTTLAGDLDFPVNPLPPPTQLASATTSDEQATADYTALDAVADIVLNVAGNLLLHY